MQISKILGIAILTGGMIATSAAAADAIPPAKPQGPKLLVVLPDRANTPDGCALSASGEIILSVHNFNNDTLI
jgi:hypothetical protein